MFKYYLAVFLVLSGVVPAQSIKKGFKLLEKKEYDKSAAEFKDAIAENMQNPAANFGLSMIYGDEKSSLYNLIDAWDYALKTKQGIDKIIPDELTIIGDYFLATEVRQRSIPVRKKMEYALETIEAKLIKFVREENNLDIVYAVLDRFPDFRYHDNVIHIRNQLEFRKYEKQNTLEGYIEFMKKFPDAAQIEKAKKYRNQLAFDQAKQVNTVEAYRTYLKTYAGAAESSTAVKLLYAAAFEKAKQTNTIAGFDTFMADYPDALEVADARKLQKQLLYEYARKIRTLEAYNEFIRKYPEGQQYIDIFNLRSMDIGKKYIDAHAFPSSNVQWARSFGDESTIELSAALAVDSLNACIAGGTRIQRDTGYSDVWVIKMGTDGQMIWNKMVGEEYNDELSFLELSGKNGILGVGHTWLGTDSSSRQTWIFKLGPDGQKIWSKKLGRLEVNCLLVKDKGILYLGGYEANDSTGEKYAVLSLNESGKRLWNRTYTGNGQIVNLAQFPDGRLLLTGTHWRAKIDPHGYLVWESAFGPADSVMNTVMMPKGDILYLGLRNKTKVVMIKTNTDNKTLAEKEILLPEAPVAVPGLINASAGTCLALIDFSNYQAMVWINTITGEVSKTVKLPEGMNITALKKDMQGNLLLVAHPGEILVVKNTSLSF